MIGCRTAVVVCLLALALPLQHRMVEAKVGDCTKEKKTQQETCHDQCTETPGNNPHSLNYPCPLLNQLYYYATCGCVSQLPNHGTGTGLSYADQTAMLQWISDTEVMLESCNGDINDTVIVDVSLSLQLFFQSHMTIQKVFSYLSINDSAGAFYGTVIDFVELHVVLQYEVVGPVLVIDSSGNCPMTNAITQAAASSGNQQIISECQNLTMHINSMLQQPGFNVSEQLSFIYQLIIQECSVQTISFLSSSCSISGFGCFASIFDMCEVNFRIQTMNVYMSGSNSANCEFLADLQTMWNATCYSGSPNSTQCNTLVNFIDAINVVFSSSVSIEGRMQGCTDTIFQYCKLAPWICGIQMERGGCSLHDISYCSAFCHNEDCCDWNSPPPSLPECSCESGSGSGSGGSGGSGSGETSAPHDSGETSAPHDSGETSAPNDSGETSAPHDSGETSAPNDSGETSAPNDSGETSAPVDSGESSAPPASSAAPASTAPPASSAAPASTAPPASSAAPASTAPPASSAAPASTAPPASTARPFTATQSPGSTSPPMSHCEERQTIIVVDKSCNCSSLYLSIVKVTNNWNYTMKQSVQPVMTQIQKILYDKTLSPVQKIAAIFDQLNAFKPTNNGIRVAFFAITVYYYDMTTVYGTLGDFFTCGRTCTCSGSG